MNILFLTLLDFDSLETSNIYTDLLKEFIKHEHSLYIVSPTERRFKKKTQLIKQDKFQIVKKKIGNIQKTGFIEKGISTIFIDRQFVNAIKKYFNNISFDLVIYSTPPVSFTKTVNWIKKKYQSISYLLLKDIFPQNAVDLEVLRKKGLFSIIYLYFRKKEKLLYEISDYIGCMSELNRKYIIKNNPSININKVEVCPNSIVPTKIYLSQNKKSIRKKYGLSESDTLFIYGGNIGKPQGVSFICECIKRVDYIKNAKIMIVGSGTEFNVLQNYIQIHNIKNTILINFLPKNEFEDLLLISDVGLIFLDYRFTIPNYPSRLLSYLQASLPILMSSDENTDLATDLVEWGVGSWVPSNDVLKFEEMYIKYLDVNFREKMFSKAFDILVNKFNVRDSYDVIMKHMNKGE